MPEMPEVETIRTQLEKEIVGKKIENVIVNLPKPIKNLAPEEFKGRVIGRTIESVKRRAKLIIIGLSSGDSLLIHLKLSGRLLVMRPEDEIVKHTHVIFKLSDGRELRFWDVRQFGYIKLVEGNEVSSMPELAEFGPEALELSLEDFKNLLKSRKKGKIKPLLMNQEFIAGIGNMYADEILFYAGINPQRDVSTLTDEETKAMYEGAHAILTAAVKHRGSSVDDYLDAYGKEGGYVPYLKVYRHEGKPCPRCGATIIKIKLGGRGTHFCPVCQK